MPNYHVTRDKHSGKWIVTKEGTKRASEFVQTQKTAEKVAKQLASDSGGGEVRIHGRDGRILGNETVSASNKKVSKKSIINISRIHIIKKEDGWILKEENSQRAREVFDTKQKAIDSSKKYLRRGCEVVIHTKDGRIQEWLSKKD